MSLQSRRENVLVEFIKVIEQTSSKMIVELSGSAVAKFLAIMDEDSITEYSNLVNLFRKYQDYPASDNHDKIVVEIEEMYINLPKIEYEYVAYEDEAAAYIIRDKAGKRISPDRLTDFLNDNKFE